MGRRRAGRRALARLRRAAGAAAWHDGPVRQIVIIGCSAAGKTTLARELARRLDLEHIELDGYFHQPGWTPLPKDEFLARVAARVEEAERGWVSCGNFTSSVGDYLQSRADTILWLDLARWRVMSRVVRRTVSRVVTRAELWNGNREPLSNLYSWNPETNIIRWAWVKFPAYRREYGEAQSSGRWAHARVLRLRSPREVDEFLASETR